MNKIIIKKSIYILLGFMALSSLGSVLAVQEKDLREYINCMDTVSVNDTQNENEDTLLHIAAYLNRNSIVALLLEKGAEVNKKNKKGETPLYQALRFIQIDDCLAVSIETVSLLLKHGANPKEKNDYGNTPLNNAIFYDRTEIINQFLKYGVDADDLDEKGNTLLHDSANRGSCNVVKLLIGKMADLSAKNKEGKTPLDVAKTSHIKCLIQGEIDYRKALVKKALEEPVKGIVLPCEIRQMIIKAANGESI